MTTGTAGSLNPNGRLYKLTFHNRRNPLLGGTLQMILDGSEGIVSPDNIDFNRKGELMIQEDPTYSLVDLGRDSSVWLYSTQSGSLTRVLQINTALAMTKDTAYFPGKWETSGIIDASTILGAGWWLLNVQAHYALTDPELVEDGQLLAFRVNTGD